MTRVLLLAVLWVGAAAAQSVSATPRPVDSEKRPPVPTDDFPKGFMFNLRKARAQIDGPPTGPAFVRLADTTKDPKVLTVALGAIRLLYSPLPDGAPAHFGNDTYWQLPADEPVYRVALEHLADADPLVRSEAAAVAYLGIAAKTAPDERLARATAERMDLEPEASVRGFLLDALWSCHCGRREMAEAVVSFIERGDEKQRAFGLRRMTWVGTHGRIFQPAPLAQMHLEAERFLEDPSPALRAAAEAAWKATAPKP